MAGPDRRGGRQRPRPAPARQPGHVTPVAAGRGSADVDRIHGFRAGLAVIATRPDDVLRIACSREAVGEVERTLEAASSRRAAKASGPGASVSVMADHEIERLARSPQHEGLCLEARARRWLGAQELGDRLARTRKTAIALDRVRNSYNIGAILRSAAFFGIDAALLGAPAPHPGLDPNALRVAEGGAEHLALSRTTDLADTLSRLRARGVAVYGADGQAPTSALGFAFARPAVLVLGNEREGLGPRVRAQCDALLGIPGTGAVESLNVAVAATVLVAELTRGYPAAMEPSVAKCLLVSKILVADGMMTENERVFLDKFMKGLGLDEPSRKKVVNLEGWDQAESVVAALPMDEKRAFLSQLVDASSADGRLSPLEMQAVKQITAALGVAD